MHRLKFPSAGFARADFAQMVEAIDPCPVAVGEFDLDGIVPYCRGGASGDSRLEHRKDRAVAGSFGIDTAVLVTLFFAGGTRAMFTKIGKIIVTAVGVGPNDINASTGRDVNLHVDGPLADVERERHRVFRELLGWTLHSSPTVCI